MLEAAVTGQPVLTLRAPEFRETQEGTLHFRYLVPAGGGALRFARDLDEHLEQLADVLRHPEELQRKIGRFVTTFLRPNGLDRPATPILADAIEQLALLDRRRRPSLLRSQLRRSRRSTAVAR
jgi:hypothetical protein